MGCLVIGGEDHTIRQERQSQGSVPNLAKLPIWLHVKGLVNWYLDLGGSCSTSNCWAKLTKLPVLEVFFLTKFREKLISYLGPILQVQPSWKSVHRQMALLFQILDQWNGLYLSSLWENLKKKSPAVSQILPSARQALGTPPPSLWTDHERPWETSFCHIWSTGRNSSSWLVSEELPKHSLTSKC